MVFMYNYSGGHLFYLIILFLISFIIVIIIIIMIMIILYIFLFSFGLKYSNLVWSHSGYSRSLDIFQVQCGAVLTATLTSGPQKVNPEMMMMPSTIKNGLFANEPDVSVCCCQVITAAEHLLLKLSQLQFLLCLHVIQCVAQKFLSCCT